MNIKNMLFILLVTLLGMPTLHAMEQRGPNMYSPAGAQTFERIIAQIKKPTEFQGAHIETIGALTKAHQDSEGQLKEAVARRDVDKARLCFQFLPQDQAKWELLKAVRDYKEEDAKFLLQFTDASYFYIHTVDDKEAQKSDPRIQAAPITIHFSWQDDPEDTSKPYSFWATYGMTKLLTQNGCKFGKEQKLADQNLQKILDITAEQKDDRYYEELIQHDPHLSQTSLLDAIKTDNLKKAKFCLQYSQYPANKLFFSKGMWHLHEPTGFFAQEETRSSYEMTQLLLQKGASVYGQCLTQPWIENWKFVANMAIEKQDNNYYRKVVKSHPAIETFLWSDALDKNDTEMALFIDHNHCHPLIYGDYAGAGYTALHRVARNGNGPLTDLLIKNGADIEATSNAGVPVARVAKGEARQAIQKEMLERKTAAVASIQSICPDFPPQVMNRIFGNPELAGNPLSEEATSKTSWYKKNAQLMQRAASPTKRKRQAQRLEKKENKEEQAELLAHCDTLLAARGTKTESAPTRALKKYRFTKE